MTTTIDRIRGVLRVIAFSLLTGGVWVTHVVATQFVRLLNLRMDPLNRAVFRAWSRGVLRILNVRVEEVGPRPEAPFFLVSNHLSYIDIAVLGSRLDCVFVAKADIDSWPIFGTLVRAVGTIYVDRASKRDIPRVSALIHDTMERGRGIVLFPEGTSTDGSTVLTFKPALLEPAATAGVPVATAALTYVTPPSTEPARMAICWWGEMTFSDHALKLFRHPGFTARVTFGDPTGPCSDRKTLAADLWKEVSGRFEPVTGSEGFAPNK
jgi:1-acyl-sn-glycerol-3-phosphate acyltransferase